MAASLYGICIRFRRLDDARRIADASGRRLRVAATVADADLPVTSHFEGQASRAASGVVFSSGIERLIEHFSEAHEDRLMLEKVATEEKDIDRWILSERKARAGQSRAIAGYGVAVDIDTFLKDAQDGNPE
ncbi:MAG TPA: hypothetical protein VEI02_11105 [Planctomycetota bacterium]|nr:hypothetical protein [Planctomycetota bacterium]